MAHASSGHRGRRVFLVGATGTIGRATARVLVARGHEVVCFVRTRPGPSPGTDAAARLGLPAGARLRFGTVTDPASLAQDGLRGERFDTLVSCLASRTGRPRDAFAIDHDAHLALLAAAQASGIGHMVLLSAICVQKPLLAFQQAKLAFERTLIASGVDYTIVRPTAFFKSLSGQVARVRRGRPWLLFGDGTLTACKPISDDDCAEYLATCLREPDRWNRILPIGGPGMAITLKQQGELLFSLAGKPPKFTSVPVAMFDVIIGALSVLGTVIPPLRNKAEFARIGRYYATESMLVWDAQRQRYDAAATPSFGNDTLAEYYTKMLRGEVADDRGEHAVF